MTTSQRKAVARYRSRQTRKGFTRIEVQVHKDDAVLIREIAHALGDPERERQTRSLLRERFSGNRSNGLKALLAAAPLEGIDLTRETDLGRDVDL